MRKLAMGLGLLMGTFGAARPAPAQALTPFQPSAWFTALSEEYHNSFVQVQVGTGPEGPVVKAVFEDSVAAALPFDQQEAAAQAVAHYILAHAAAPPKLGLMVVGWRWKVDGVPTAQTFRFPVAELEQKVPVATPQ
jgi:hypothetical protein